MATPAAAQDTDSGRHLFNTTRQVPQPQRRASSGHQSSDHSYLQPTRQSIWSAYQVPPTMAKLEICTASKLHTKNTEGLPSSTHRTHSSTHVIHGGQEGHSLRPRTFNIDASVRNISTIQGNTNSEQCRIKKCISEVTFQVQHTNLNILYFHNLIVKFIFLNDYLNRHLFF